MSKRVPKEPLLLTQLRKANREASRLFPQEFDKGFGAVGLILMRTLVNNYYDWCTPLNCWTFAGTGGDGVHFSFLEKDGVVSENSPIVVTQPAIMGTSWIVGENLRDFLAFGAYRGFLPFETIGLEWRPISSWRKLWTLEEDKQSIVNFLVRRFKLKPWATIKRFRHLQKTFLKELDLPPEVKQ